MILLQLLHQDILIESNEIKNYVSKNLNLKTQILNKNDKILNDKEIIIINSFGVLHNYFKICKKCFYWKIY